MTIIQCFATTDVHNGIPNYDYRFKQVTKEGLSVLMDQIKERDKDKSLLLDNGDFLQGDIIGNMSFDHFNKDDQDAPNELIQYMNKVGYDVIALGNHEFNYGLDYLQYTMKHLNATVVNSNVTYEKTNEHFTTPYVIRSLQVDESTRPLKIGIYSVVPEQILNWDKFNLEGILNVESMYQCSQKMSKQLKEQYQCDLVVCLAHTGMQLNLNEDIHHENQAHLIAKDEYLDGIVFGHTHEQFPGLYYDGLDEVDNDKSLIHNTLAVQPLSSGRSIGVLNFDVSYDDTTDRYMIKDQFTEHIMSDHEVTDIPHDVLPLHEALLQYVDEPVAQIEEPVTSYTHQITPNETTFTIAKATYRYVNEMLDILDKDIPVISSQALFKGGRDGIKDFIHMTPPTLTMLDAINLYKHENNLAVVKVNKKQLKEWMEFSNGHLAIEDEQYIVKPGFPTYNCDIFYGLNYSINLDKPRRYNSKGIQESDHERVQNIELSTVLNDKEDNSTEIFDDYDEFYVITNEYRINTFEPLKSCTNLVDHPVPINKIVLNDVKNYGLSKLRQLPIQYHYNQYPGKLYMYVPTISLDVIDKSFKLDDHGELWSRVYKEI